MCLRMAPLLAESISRVMAKDGTVALLVRFDNAARQVQRCATVAMDHARDLLVLPSNIEEHFVDYNNVWPLVVGIADKAPQHARLVTAKYQQGLYAIGHAQSQRERAKALVLALILTAAAAGEPRLEIADFANKSWEDVLPLVEYVKEVHHAIGRPPLHQPYTAIDDYPGHKSMLCDLAEAAAEPGVRPLRDDDRQEPTHRG